ncbi:MAG: SpoIIE family protein phosphatase [Melioribacteraceae bacterium]
MIPDKNIIAHRNLAALVDYSNLINSSLDLSFILNNILLTCFSKFQITKGIIAIIDSNNFLELKVIKGFSNSDNEKFPKVKLEEINTNLKMQAFIAQFKISVIEKIESNSGTKGVVLLGSKLSKNQFTNEDLEFLKTLLNLGATAVENSLTVERLKNVNRELDSKVNQLSSLFDLSKEFSGILEIEVIGKLLVYSIIGQLLVSKYAVVTCGEKSINILESKYDVDQIKESLKICEYDKINESLDKEHIAKKYPDLSKFEIECIVPMKIKSVTKGLILLGKRITNKPFLKSDVEYISSVGSLAIISLENASMIKDLLEKEKLEKDLEIARNIQQNLLPKKIPQYKEFSISAYSLAAKTVGGDYFDIVKLDDNRILLAIADVSGKGVPAALIMANLQAFLKSICKQNLPLDESTNLINDLISENTSNGSFVTFFWGIFDKSSLEFTYVNAGHNPPLLIRNGEIIKLKKGGMIIGVMPTIIPYVSETVKMVQNDVIFFFTDGISEAMNIDFEEFTDEKLERIVLEERLKSSDDILGRIKNEVDEHTKGAEQSDDITCLIIKVN